MSTRQMVACVLLLTLATGAAGQEHSSVPPLGYVPDSGTAEAIARAVLIPIYGKGRVAAQEPLRAKEVDGTWEVTGTLPPNMLGGVALVRINRMTGQILRVTHGR